MESVVILGASGFLGSYLLNDLSRRGNYSIRIMNRSRDAGNKYDKPIDVICGNIFDQSTLIKIIEPGCTVINLVYIWDGGEEKNLSAISNLLEACKAGGAGQLIHCSTAAVVGRTPVNIVNENTRCCPVTEYGITKLKIENEILKAAKDNFKVKILRPTSIYGPGGEPLKKLCCDLISGNTIKNYLKSCLFGNRRMNLVHVANVVESIHFLIQHNIIENGEIFIVSDDDELMNNFVDVEKVLMDKFDLPDYSLPRFQLPFVILSILLRCLGRNNINPECSYSQYKLNSAGFNSPVKFMTGLREYADWYRLTYLSN